MRILLLLAIVMYAVSEIRSETYYVTDSDHLKDLVNSVSPEPNYKSSMRDTIDHNYFRNNNPLADNEKESIRVGWSKLLDKSLRY